jgi:hypothetical protein
MDEMIPVIFPVEPDWSPLHQVIDEKERNCFMFMGQALLSEGRIINLYKHIRTRRYINLSNGKEGIKAHAYRANDYVSIPIDEALKSVLS